MTSQNVEGNGTEDRDWIMIACLLAANNADIEFMVACTVTGTNFPRKAK